MCTSYFLLLCIVLNWRAHLTESQVDLGFCIYQSENGLRYVQLPCSYYLRNDLWHQWPCNNDIRNGVNETSKRDSKLAKESHFHNSSEDPRKHDELRDTQNTVMLTAVSSFEGLVILILIIGILLYYKKRRQCQHQVTKTDILNPSQNVEFSKHHDNDKPLHHSTNYTVDDQTTNTSLNNRRRRWSSPSLLYIEGNSTIRDCEVSLSSRDNDSFANPQGLSWLAEDALTGDKAKRKPKNDHYISMHPYTLVKKERKNETNRNNFTFT